METITIKINSNSKAGKMLKDLLEMFSDKPGVQVIREESPYNPEFVKMINKSVSSKKRYRVNDVDKLWESL
ncbi:MAG: hypothetical protein H3C31_12490 [Brumimicrobium sp.]|nr:hypothetical protein [Brumimicrobium sp.]MCO5268247.1 hypothetical protein [Brumimicrobium sp.]